MESKGKRRLTYSVISIAGAVILILAIILMQQPIQKTALPLEKTPPGVSTAAATGIGQTAATLNGNLGSLGTASSVTAGFLYGTSSSLAGATNVSVGTKTAAASLVESLTGLASGTTYYYEAWGLGDGFSTGTVLPFTTLTPTTPPPSQVRAPSVETNAASSIGTTGATLNGGLGNLGTASIVTVGFLYGTSSSLAGATNVSAGAQSATGDFAKGVSGLQPSTEYFVRAWAAGKGFASGAVVLFTTASPGGNGNKVPPGWAHAACPDLHSQAVAHGLRARCVDHMTYGEMKKQSVAGAEPTSTAISTSGGNDRGAATRTSDPGNSGDHRSANSRQW